jgi:hypothetical protein
MLRERLVFWGHRRAPVIQDRDDGRWVESKPINLLDAFPPHWSMLNPGREMLLEYQKLVVPHRNMSRKLLKSIELLHHFSAYS